jgi:LacI family transcriptional regulator
MSRRESPGPRDVTIKDVARMLGLSPSTVSRALSDHPHVREATKERVRAAARTLDYVPNAAAQSIQRRRSSLIGLIVPDIHNEFYASVANVVSERCAAESFQLVLAITDDRPDLELLHVRALRQARAAAIAITASAAPLPETVALLRQMHTVQFVRSHTQLPGPMLLIAEHAATMAATRQLIDLGHRRIAFIGGSTELSTGQERLSGFRDALSLAGIDASERWIRLGPPRATFGRAAMTELVELKSPPSAVVVCGYELTAGATEAAFAAGLAMPGDLSLIGYGDTAWARLVGGGLSMIALPVQEIADTLAEVILRHVRQPRKSAEEEQRAIIFQPSLTLRGSTGRPSLRRVATR